MGQERKYKIEGERKKLEKEIDRKGKMILERKYEIKGKKRLKREEKQGKK